MASKIGPGPPPENQTWDAIVIGSGIGGLTAAGLLAKVAGKKVLVLEKHSERGGLTHTFRRDGASWDVGVHYVGDIRKGNTIYKLFDFLSGGALKWNKMPDDFDRFVYPDMDFSVPSDRRRYEKRLIKAFPDEAAAIHQYFQDIRKAANWHQLGMVESAMPWPISSLIAFWRHFGSAEATQTTAEYLNHHFKSDRLKTLLASQWGDYGLPPSKSAFGIHSLVVCSYLKGAWFPVGGSSRIARTFEVGIEAYGGAIKVCQEVTSILTEGTRAVGVRVLDRRGAEAGPTEVEYRAPIIISSAGTEITYCTLLPSGGKIGRLTAPVRDCIDLLKGGPSAVTVYLQLDQSVSTLGISGENYWISASPDPSNDPEQEAGVLSGRPKWAFLSFPSIKSGDDDRFHTAEILTLVNTEAFSRWAETPHMMRGRDYLELKQRISKGLLDLAESAVPGLKAIVRYSEVSTPLSMEHYVSHADMYGLKATPARFQCHRDVTLAKSPISGLYISGQDASSLGVAGAMMGGVIAASQVLGWRGFMRIMKGVNSGLTATPRAGDSGLLEKKRVQVVTKTRLSDAIWRIEFRFVGQNIEHMKFVPGQYAMLRVAPFEWRSYSVAAVENGHLTLLISTRTMGDGSIFANTVEPGAETELELPFGTYRLQRNANRKIFVCTGTGLAPFLPMFSQLKELGDLDSAELLFGCRTVEDDITREFNPLPRTTVCVSRDATARGEHVVHGLVTEALADLSFDPATTDFYLCGAAGMVEDCRTLLVRAGATQIMTELY